MQEKLCCKKTICIELFIENSACKFWEWVLLIEYTQWVWLNYNGFGAHEQYVYNFHWFIIICSLFMFIILEIIILRHFNHWILIKYIFYICIKSWIFGRLYGNSNWLNWWVWRFYAKIVSTLLVCHTLFFVSTIHFPKFNGHKLNWMDIQNDRKSPNYWCVCVCVC